MNEKSNIKGSAILCLAALIWGLAFVAQDKVSGKISPLALNCVRSLVAFALLSLFFIIKGKGKERIFSRDKTDLKTSLKGGAICGGVLAISANLQQAGITVYPKGVAVSARAGFLTALYVIIVPILSVFVRKSPKIIVWVSAAIAMTGVYLLCLSGGIHGFYKGDLFLIACALCFSFHIITVDKFCFAVGGVRLACIQFLFCGIFSGVLSLIFESAKYSSFDFTGAIPYILFLAVFSSCGGYTLQIVGQKYAEAPVASLSMSLESVFAALGGYVILGNRMTPREVFGCVLVFAAIVLAQMPGFSKKKTKKTAL